MLVNDSKILIESEDRAGQEKRLRHIVEQTSCHVIDMDHLIGNERDTAHDEQQRTNVLRDFEAFVFHGVRYILLFYLFTFLPLHQGCFTCRTENQRDDVTKRLKDRLYCFVHNCNVLNGLKIRVILWPKPRLFLLCKVTKNIRDYQTINNISC